MNGVKKARHRYGKAHGSPCPERVTGDDPPTAYATCTPLHTTPPSKDMDGGKKARHRYGKADGSPRPERVTGDDPPTA